MSNESNIEALRAVLAEAVRPMIDRVHEPLRSDIVGQWTETLLPLVERLRVEFAQQQLRQAAEAWDAAEPGDRLYLESAVDWIRERADALTTTPTLT